MKNLRFLMLIGHGCSKAEIGMAGDMKAYIFIIKTRKERIETRKEKKMDLERVRITLQTALFLSLVNYRHACYLQEMHINLACFDYDYMLFYRYLV